MKPLRISSLILFCSLCIVSCIFAAGNASFESDISNTSEKTSSPGKSAKSHSSIPTIRPSNIITILQNKKTKNPTISNKQLAKFGNRLLKSKGLNFTFSWDPKGKTNEANLRKVDYDKLTPFFYKFTRTDGKLTEFRLLNRDFGHPCFSIIDIPITQVSERAMTVISGGKQIRLKRPKDFYLEEV